MYYKGFDKNFKCRGFKYKVGKTYQHDGEIKACESGFHACEYPLAVFNYYAPSASRFALVEAGGKIVQSGDKIACEKIKIEKELFLDEVIKAAVEYAFSRAKKSKKTTATGNQGAASATGNYGIACGLGYQCKAKGAKGCWLVLAERNEKDEILSIKAAKVDGKKIKEDTFYILEKGDFKEAENYVM